MKWGLDGDVGGGEELKEVLKGGEGWGDGDKGVR